MFFEMEYLHSPAELFFDTALIEEMCSSLLGPNLIVSPRHEALLPNVLPQNVEAMAEAALEM